MRGCRPGNPIALLSAQLASKILVVKETVKNKALDEEVFGPLAASTAILFVANELFYRAHNGFGEDSMVVDVLWHVVRVGAGLALVALVGVLGARGWRYVSGRLG